MQYKMPFHVISCHMHNECYMDNTIHTTNECYMDNTIHTTYRCHGQSNHLDMTSINHFIHVNLSCKHISTFTFNMSFYDQAIAHTRKPCNGHFTKQFISCQHVRSHTLTPKHVTLSQAMTLDPQDQLWHKDAYKKFHTISHHSPQNSSELSSETSPLTVPKSGHKPLNNLSCSSPRKWTIT